MQTRAPSVPAASGAPPIRCPHGDDARSAFPLSSPTRDPPGVNDPRREGGVAMCKTILGSTTVIFCGVLLIPLLINTAPPSTPGAAPAPHRVAASESAKGRNIGESEPRQ